MDEHTLNDLLECSVCLERLDTSSKVLPCQHTFCRKCLEVIVSSRQELRCPECRVLVDIKIDDLPPNVLLMRILEGMKNAAAAKTQQQLHFETSKVNNSNNNDSNKIEETQKLNEEHQQQIKLKQQQQKQLLQYQQQLQQQYKQKQFSALQQHQQHSTSGQPTTINTSTSQCLQQQHHQQQQQQHQTQRRCHVPHAYALYDFESSEPSDLCFKKGELVLLKRKIDINWFVGQLPNGNEGTFPINYVQIILPLPSPQCIALYDFKMGPNEEEGCLTFKKGTLIHVLRRVDHNWAEGRIGSTIGIFPIAFVDLNALAKQLLDSFVLLSSPPPLPPTATATANTLQQQHNSQPTQQLPTSSQPRNLPPIPPPILDPTTNSHPSDSCSSSSSSVSSSPHTTSPQSTTITTTCSSSNSLPNSPIQSLPNTPQHVASTSVRYRDRSSKEKRHSLNALLSAGAGGVAPALSILQSNRHSAEILSMPNELNTTVTDVSHNLRSHSGTVAENMSRQAEGTNVALPQTTVAREQQQPPQSSSTNTRVNVLKTGAQHNVPTSLPWGYLALYPYKPRKADELELKKGCVYIVTERCLDGWFKGKNWQDAIGVFPGNYVTPLRNRDQQQLMHQWKYVPLQQINTTQPTNTTNLPAATAVNTKNQNQLENLNTRLVSGSLPHQPPDLPPRQLAAAHTSSVWTKPLSQTVEAFFNRSSSNSNNIKAPAEHNIKDSKEKSETKQKMDISSSSSSAAVSLMKRLAHIKSRSKSPNTAMTAANSCNATAQSHQQNSNINYSMDNPTFEDAALPTIQQITANHAHILPVHVRSGSCPSQLLQSLPIDVATGHINDNVLAHQKQQQVSPQATYGSQRIKGSKERPPLHNIRQSMDGTYRSCISNNSSNQAQAAATSNVLPTKCSQQQQQQQFTTNKLSNTTIHHRKSQSLDANSVIAPMLPIAATTSDTSNVNAAAIAASATTKSSQNMRESRFRCIVPYPPNSDVELELHIGDIIYVQRKQKNGWYKGTHSRTNKTGLFPASFVEPDI